MYRYLALLWNPQDTEAGDAASSVQQGMLASAERWEVAFQGPGVLVCHTGARSGSAEAYELPEKGGVVLGTLFKKHDTDHTTRQTIIFDHGEARKVVVSLGQHLIERYWGSYVAIITDQARDAHHILRDPMAALPCFHATWRGIETVFSHVGDCIRYVPIRVSINWKQLTAYLLVDEFLSRETGLLGVEDVPGGELLTFSERGTRRTPLWRPSEFCRSPLRLDARTAAAELRRTVQMAVDAWASCYPSIVHRLSGGLDSSIVAGCLSRAPATATVTGLNFYTGATERDEQIFIANLSKENLAKVRRMAGHADEREFARLVAKEWGYNLIERERRVNDIQLARLWNAPIAVRPSRYVHVIDTDQFEIEAVRQTGASAVFDGLAGDTVFYTTFQAIGAIDYAYEMPWRRHLLRQVADAASLSGESLWRVASKAFRHGILRRPIASPFDLLSQPHLLASNVVEHVTDAYTQHPWSDMTSDLPPGKRSHVQGITVSGLFYPHEYGRDQIVPSIHPLAAQPIVELSMRLPTYTLLTGGVSRGLARLAFADLLPQKVRKRTTKGVPTTFYQHLMHRNLQFIRESLLDGLLVRDGLLDRERVAGYLTEDQLFRTVQPVQILAYLSGESWLRQWSSTLNQSRATTGNLMATAGTTNSDPVASLNGVRARGSH